MRRSLAIALVGLSLTSAATGGGQLTQRVNTWVKRTPLADTPVSPRLGYEGKHIDQWLTDTKPVVRWLSVEACEKKSGKPPSPQPKLVFRDIARNTDERTCIAAVLAERSCLRRRLSGSRSGHGAGESQ